MTTEVNACTCVYVYLYVPNHMDYLISYEPNPANPLPGPGEAINSSADTSTYSPSDSYTAWPNICHVVNNFLTAHRKRWAPVSGPQDPLGCSAKSQILLNLNLQLDEDEK